jgi:hypothetical protein
MVLFAADMGGEDVVSFVVQLRVLYLNKDFFTFEKKVIWKISELIKDGSRESLLKLYCSLDPLYQLLYCDTQENATPISARLRKMIEVASLPLYQMSEEVRGNYLLKLRRMLSKDQA